MGRTYTEAEKATAVALAVDTGLTEAAKELGYPKQTIDSWLTSADRSQMAGRSEAKTRAATEEHTRRMALRRIDAQREFMESAVWCARQIRQAEDGKDAHGYAMAGGTSLDKVRLELGEVTDRTEHVAPPERTPDVETELAQLYDMAEHRAA